MTGTVEAGGVPLRARLERGAYGAAVAFIVFVVVGVGAAAVSSNGTISTDQASVLGLIGLGVGLVMGYRAYRRVSSPRV